MLKIVETYTYKFCWVNLLGKTKVVSCNLVTYALNLPFICFNQFRACPPSFDCCVIDSGTHIVDWVSGKLVYQVKATPSRDYTITVVKVLLWWQVTHWSQVHILTENEHYTYSNSRFHWISWNRASWCLSTHISYGFVTILVTSISLLCCTYVCSPYLQFS